MTIWKFPVEIRNFERAMPTGALFMSVQMQGGSPCMWLMVDPERIQRPHRFAVYGTGHTLQNTAAEKYYLGTFQQGSFVWHLWGETEPVL